MRKPTRHEIHTVTGEMLVSVLNNLFDLPQDAKIVKIIHSASPDYSFDIVLSSDFYHEVAEGAYPLRTDKR